jgi:hypothetical protein
MKVLVRHRQVIGDLRNDCPGPDLKQPSAHV